MGVNSGGFRGNNEDLGVDGILEVIMGVWGLEVGIWGVIILVWG